MKKALISLLVLIILPLLLFSCCTQVGAPSPGESSRGGSTAPSKARPASSEEASLPSDGSSEEAAASSAEVSEDRESSADEAPDGDRVIRFVACPDNIIHTSVYCSALQRAAEKAGVKPDYSDLDHAAYDFAPMYEDIAPLVKKADIAYINMLALVGGNEYGVSGHPTLNAPEALGETLVDMGFNVFGLANDHVLDRRSDSRLINCARFFRERGGIPLGYYENEAATDNIVILEKKGVKIAFLAYTYGTNGTKPDASPTYIPYIEKNLIKRQMKLARERADLIFVSMYWGDGDSFNVNFEQRRTAQLLSEEGADVIIGMRPHTIQEAKWLERPGWRSCFIVYSLGNLVSGMYGGKNALGAILSLDIVAKNGKMPYVDNVRLLPTVCHYVKKQEIRADGDTGFTDFKVYLLENYTDELALAHGCRQNKDDITSFDKELDGNFHLDTLYVRTRRTYPAEFLSEAINEY